MRIFGVALFGIILTISPPAFGRSPVPPPQSDSLVGDWSGVLVAGPRRLNLVFHIAKAPAPSTLDSPDQSARGIPVPARVYDPVQGRGAVKSARTNMSYTFRHNSPLAGILEVRSIIATWVGVPTEFLEETSVLRYRAGEQFHRHFDYLNPSNAQLAREISERGQRVATLLVYLNADYEGGETVFPMVSLRHRGGKGDALMFANVTPDGLPDRRTMHAGVQPRAGEKWLLSQFVRNRDCSKSL